MGEATYAVAGLGAPAVMPKSAVFARCDKANSPNIVGDACGMKRARCAVPFADLQDVGALNAVEGVSLP
jgi:hypothetical protein